MRSLDPRPSTLLHVRQVLPAGRVPRRHVLLHAVGVASRFAGRERGAGGGDAAVEAVFVEFLSGSKCQNTVQKLIALGERENLG